MVAKDAQTIAPTQASSVATNYFNAAFNRPEVQSLQVTASIGVATFPAPRVATVEDLFMRADQALYRAKAEGRNRVRN